MINNKRGNLMINLLFLVFAVAVVVVFITPLKVFTDMAQQSNALNCYGYIYNGNANHTLSFNSTLNGGNSGSPLACTAISLYLPYILLVVLITGVAKVLYDRSSSFVDGSNTFSP